jgi:hypothetical protein
MKVSVPTSLKDIKLKDYQKYQKELERLESINADDSKLMISKISLLCNVSYEKVLNIESVDIWKISRLIDDVLRIEPELVEKFIVEDIKFGWLPNLDTMKWGEFLDLNDNISNWETMHIAMGVLYRPIIEEDKKGRYNVGSYEGDKYHEYLKEMTLESVVGCMVFFWNLGMDCVIAITKYLEMPEMKFQNQLNLVESGVGLQQSMNSLVEMLQSLKK